MSTKDDEIRRLIEKYGRNEIERHLAETKKPAKKGRNRKDVDEADLDRMADLIVSGAVKGKNGTFTAAGMVLADRMSRSDSRFDGDRRTMVRHFGYNRERLIAAAHARRKPKTIIQVRAPSLVLPPETGGYRRATITGRPNIPAGLLGEALAHDRRLMEIATMSEYDIMRSRDPLLYGVQQAITAQRTAFDIDSTARTEASRLFDFEKETLRRSNPLSEFADRERERIESLLNPPRTAWWRDDTDI